MTKTDTLYISTQAGFLLALLALLPLGLLPTLLSGLLVYYIVNFGAHALGKVGIIPHTGKLVLLFLIAALTILAIAVAIGALAARFSAGPESLYELMQKMADVVATARNHLPLWLQEKLPSNVAEMEAATSEWLRENARSIGVVGKDTIRLLAHIAIGMILGGMVAMSPAFHAKQGPLAHAAAERAAFLSRAFRRIVFSQIRISALNTFLTAIFLVGVLPLLDIRLPLVQNMIAVTFITGLLPIVGNLISNTVIFLVGLSVSPFAAVITLLYLVVIHKLEYFINARIIGSRIHSRAWEILLAMLVMESAFGVAGVIAAPIYYAYIKDELSSRKLI